MENNYEIGRVLGRGSFATVHLARWKQKRVYALKLVDLTARSQDSPPSIRAADSKNTLQQLLRREISIHSASHHVNVVRFVESFCYTAIDNVTHSERRMMAMVLEYCSGGDLGEYFTKLRDRRRKNRVANRAGASCSWLMCREGTFLASDEIKHAAMSILSGLSYLHAKGIVHRDIKAGNIYLVPHSQQQQQPQQPLHNEAGEAGDDRVATKNEMEQQLPLLTSYTLKIGDFGLAVRMDDDEDWCECRTTVCGTPSCLAPEVVRGAMKAETSVGSIVQNASLRPSDNSQPWIGYGQPADLWSTGCLLYTMIVGRNPFALPSCRADNPKNNSPDIRGDKNGNPHDMKMARVAATIDRVAREDWALPAHVSISDNLEGLLNQLLESSPRKRGTARGILAFHPYFIDSSTKSVKKCYASSFKGEVSVEEKENINKYNNSIHKLVSPSNIEENCNNEQATTDFHDLKPIEGLHRLQPLKYEWTEGRAQFAVFLLGRDGLVVHEKKHGNGRWLHLSSDGKGVVSGYLKPDSCTLDLVKHQKHNSNSHADHLYHEAFGCAPQKFQFSRQSKIMSLHAKHQPLDKLLIPANKGDLRLYKTAERFVLSVKSSTPKIIVYLFSPKTSLQLEKVKGSHHRMFAKVMLMENGPYADIEAAFVEGTTFQLRGMGQKRGRMIVRWINESIPNQSTFDFDSIKVWRSDLVDLVKEAGSPEILTMAKKLTHHFRVVQSAFEECSRLEQSQRRQKTDDEIMFPITINLATSGGDTSQWVVMDEIAAIPVGRLISS